MAMIDSRVIKKQAFLSKLLARALFLLFATLSSASAVEIHELSLEDFTEKSKEKPEKLFLLRVSSQHCGACMSMSQFLESVPQDKSVLNQAFWNDYSMEKSGNSVNELLTFLKKRGISWNGAVPFVVGFKKGEPLGTYLGYGSPEDLIAFLSEVRDHVPASLAPPEDNELFSVPKFSCSQTQSDDYHIIGISGDGHELDDGQFGILNLLNFSEFFENSQTTRLFANRGMGLPESRPSNVSSHGFLLTRSRFAKYSDILSTPDKLELGISDLPPSSEIKLLLTGHGSRSAVTVGEGSITNETIKRDIRNTTSLGSSLKAVVTQCFGGQFAESFMPESATNAKKSCGVFASIPSKMASGCYPKEMLPKNPIDYFGYMARMKSCDSPQDTRSLHYKIVEKSKGPDIPMSTSEYFLLYGAGAETLSSGKLKESSPRYLVRQFYQPHPFQEETPNDRISFSVDLVNERFFQFSRGVHALPVPEIQRTGCVDDALSDEESTYSFEKLGINNLSFMRTRSFGPSGINSDQKCRSIYRFSWDEEVGIEPFSLTLTLKHGILTTVEADGRRKQFDSDSNPPFNFPETPRGVESISINDLTPESKFYLTQIESTLLALPSTIDALRTEVQRVVNELAPYNQVLSKYLGKLYIKAHSESIEQRESGLTPQLLADYQLSNLTNNVVYRNEVSQHRLAHLYSVGLAETLLRKRANTGNSRATELLKQYKGLIECEKRILE